MMGHKKLKEPKTIVTTCKENPFATATGGIWGHVIGEAGRPVSVRVSILVFPEQRHNVFVCVKTI